MNEIIAIGALDKVSMGAVPMTATEVQQLRDNAPNALSFGTQPSGGFASIISDSLARMDAKIAHADQMVAQFAIDDSTPIHHVTIALEEARLSVELAMQVRQRFVEGYRELMNLQL